MSQARLERGWRAKAGSLFGRQSQSGNHSRRRVTEDQRSPGLDVVDVAIPVDVPDPRSVAAIDKNRVLPNRPKGSDRAINSAGNNRPSVLEHRAGLFEIQLGLPEPASDVTGKIAN